MADPKEYSAVIIAGGHSSRMGTPKPLLPLGNTTAVERTADIFRQAGLTDILVVLGCRSDETAVVLDKSGIRYIINENFEDGMFSSIKKGVKSISEKDSKSRAFFLLPVDCPLVRPYTILRLMDTYDKFIMPVIYPVFNGDTGHPPLIDMRCADRILEWKGDGGLRELLKEYDDSSVKLELNDPGIIFDMDIPDDYRKANARFVEGIIPDRQECLYILEKLNVPDKIVSHMEVVESIALRITERLTIKGQVLDIDVIRAAALLHDIAKGCISHAQVGAEKVARLGYPRVASIIAQHTDIIWERGNTLDEACIVYLADKMVRGTEIVDLSERMSGCCIKYEQDTDAMENSIRRLYTAISISQTVEGIIGRDPL